MTDGASGNMITAGIILGAVVAAGAILLMPFVAGNGNPGLSIGWFGAMISPLVIAMMVAGARATFLRPYSPEADYLYIRQSMGHILYMHQVLIEEARTTFDCRLTEWQERYDENRDRIAQSFRQQLALLGPSLDKFNSAASAVGPEWGAPVWRTWTPSTRMPRVVCVGEMLAGIREDRISFPALIPFPNERALIIKTDSQARDRAIEAIQSIVLRLVATVPTADLRLILMDPIGQGKNVAPFTPFADVGIGLGKGRSWTEQSQIEQRLHDLANMVEGAVEANAFTSMLPRLDPSRANGVAEPCRVFVMLDFPNAVSGATSRLLNSIIQKGPTPRRSPDHHGGHGYSPPVRLQPARAGAARDDAGLGRPALRLERPGVQVVLDRAGQAATWRAGEEDHSGRPAAVSANGLTLRLSTSPLLQRLRNRLCPHTRRSPY